MSANTKRSRQRKRPQPPQPPEPLAVAKAALRNAVHDLTAQRIEYLGGAIQTLPSRYVQLRYSLYGGRDSHSRTLPSSVLPTWIDALKLLGWIDRRAAILERRFAPQAGRHCPTWRHMTPRPTHLTIVRYQQVLAVGWRPQDTSTVNQLTSIVGGYAKAIDDLFAPPPVPLRGERCPHCKQTHARVKTDDGQTVTRPALAITSIGVGVCNACHDTFPSLEFLGDLLRYAKDHPEPEDAEPEAELEAEPA